MAAVSAEVLREASALMRTRAEGASAGPWKRFGMAGVAGADWEIGCATNADALHIASWHPAVALAVADWLDACALVTEVAPDRHKGLALAVARAYLGETS